MKRSAILLLASFAFAACSQETVVETPVEAAQPSEFSIAVENAYIFEPLRGRDVTAGFVTMTNNGASTRLLSASSPATQTIELHTHMMEEGVMKMREVEAIDVPAGETVVLQPRSLHLMMFGFSPEDGQQSVPVTLTFENGETLEVALPIRPRG